ncbi:MAG: PIN domain-containing protein [Flammeovirgaceae bacterium]
MRVFLDANILVSVLNREYPMFTYSSRVLSLADSNSFQVHTSPICLAIAFYFAEKKSGSVMAKRKIELLARKLGIATVDQATVLKTLRNKAITDFEDGLEYHAAEASKCKCIISEDRKHFFFSKLEVLGAREFLEKYMM